MRLSTNIQSSSLLLIGLLCVGILLQILGVPLTFWDLDGSCDLVESSLLEGFAIVSEEPLLSPILRSSSLSSTDPLACPLAPQYLFFHPPLPIFLPDIAT